MKKLFLIALLFVSAPAWATTYYVNKAGSDANSCATAQSATDANGKLTISGSAGGMSCLSGGDTLIIGNGTYVERMGARTSHDIPSGSVGAPTTIMAENRNLAIIAPNEPSDFYACEITDRVYVTIDGIICDGTNIEGNPWYVRPTSDSAALNHHVIIENGTGRNGFNDFSDGILMGSVEGHVRDSQILNMDFHDNCLPADRCHGLSIRCIDCIIDGNRSYSNGHYGGQAYRGSTGNIIRNNVFYDSPNRGGFTFSNEGSTTSGNLFYNNIIYGNNWSGLEVLSGTDNEIYNNTFYQNTDHCIDLQGGTHLVQNNICFANGTDDVFENGGTATASANILGTDPNFNNAGSADFTLTAGSTNAIDQGVTITSVANDFAGHARPVGVAYDIGAYEYDVPSTQSITVTAPITGAIQQRPDVTTTTWTVANISSGTMVLTYSFDSFVTSYPIATGVAWDGQPYNFVPTWPKHSTMQIRVCQGAICGSSPVFVTRGEYLK